MLGRGIAGRIVARVQPWMARVRQRTWEGSWWVRGRNFRRQDRINYTRVLELESRHEARLAASFQQQEAEKEALDPSQRHDWDTTHNIDGRYEKERDEVERELAEVRYNLASYRTQFLTNEAHRYAVPLPKNDDLESWDAVSSRGRVLTPHGFADLRTAIRRERRERQEFFQIRIAQLIALAGLALGVANYLQR